VLLKSVSSGILASDRVRNRDNVAGFFGKKIELWSSADGGSIKAEDALIYIEGLEMDGGSPASSSIQLLDCWKLSAEGGPRRVDACCGV